MCRHRQSDNSFQCYSKGLKPLLLPLFSLSLCFSDWLLAALLSAVYPVAGGGAGKTVL